MVRVINDTHKLNEAPSPGTTDGGIKLYVYTDEGGMIPHFHFYVDGEQGCIRLDKAEYFSHGGKTAKLNHSQKKDLVAFLNKKYKKLINGKVATNYQFLATGWNMSESPVEIDVDDMPDYMKLE